jgi:hypothetical protein
MNPSHTPIITPFLYTMSILTKAECITAKPFAKVPGLLDLPPIEHAPPSISNVSSFQGDLEGEVDLSEGCLINKAIKYTHQLMHWVNPVWDKSDDTNAIVRNFKAFIGVLTLYLTILLQQFLLSRELCIVSYCRGFTLDDPCNLTYCKSNSCINHKPI